MPNRILKETICTSESIDQLNWFEEVLFYRLIVSCDDFGRYDGRPAVLKGKLFPLKNVTIKQLEEALDSLSKTSIVLRYAVSGKSYLQLVTWDKHQTRRAVKSKYPSPSEGQVSATEQECDPLQTFASNCMQVQADAPVFVFENENENDTRNRLMHGEMRSPPCPSICSIQLQDKSDYEITQDQFERWKELYPAVDILQELRKMAGWCEASPSRRKTRAGILRFITGWLGRMQDKGGISARTGDYPKNYDAGKDFFDT
jgi:hypothetical protein